MKIPAHLKEFEATGAHQLEPVAQFEIGRHKNFVYLILDWKEKKAAIIDPQKDLSEPLSFLREHHFKLEKIFLTHTHFDHVAGVPSLLNEFSEITLCVHREDHHRLEINPASRVFFIQDHDVVSVGGLSVEVFHTPGHSAGECCFLLQSGYSYLFTGDTLFIRDCGRTDLETGSNQEMFSTLQKLKTFPPETLILPGHHYQKECCSTLEKELTESPPLRCQSLEQLIALP